MKHLLEWCDERGITLQESTILPSFVPSEAFGRLPQAIEGKFLPWQPSPEEEKEEEAEGEGETVGHGSQVENRDEWAQKSELEDDWDAEDSYLFWDKWSDEKKAEAGPKRW
ncbi:hypothetical protein JCM11641_005606 [Rhodosporidiobolus odoratus]